MKRIVILLLPVLLVNSLFAQSLTKLTKPGMHNQVINGLLQSQAGNDKAAMKTTGITMLRVIAQSTRNNTLAALNDSVNLTYSLLRGSTYDYNTMIYPYNYTYNTSPMFNFAGTFMAPQVLFDNYLHWTVNPNTLVYGFYESATAGYNTYDNVVSYKALNVDSSLVGSPNPNMVYANNFNAGHLIDTGYSSIWKLGVADSAFKQFYTYNTSNKLVKDSIYEKHLGIWRIASKTLYTYDGSNNLIQIDNYSNITDTSFLLPLIKQQKYVNTYDGSNRLLTVLDSTFDGTKLAQNQKDTFAYTGANPFHTSWKQYQWDAINGYWAPMMYMSKHLNGSSFPDTVTIKSFDSLANAWIPQAMNIVHYNASGKPDTLKDYEYNFTAYPPTPNFTTVYYYETYVNSIGVKNVYKGNDRVKVFPNPATDAITISRVDVPLNTSVSITMLNVNGQVMSRESMPWRGETQISVRDLVPGMYWVVVQDGNGKMLHRQAVVKE